MSIAVEQLRHRNLQVRKHAAEELYMMLITSARAKHYEDA